MRRFIIFYRYELKTCIMNGILVLIDLTPMSDIATNQAVQLTKWTDSQLTLCHFTKSKSSTDEIENQMERYRVKALVGGVESEILIAYGDSNKEFSQFVNSNRPRLAVVGAHSNKGVIQSLFGASTYALIRSLSTSVLAVQDHSVVHESGFRKILLPVSPHVNFMSKVTESW